MKPVLNVLVLSDDPQLLETGGLLSCFDVHLTHCSDSQAAREHARARKFDLFVVDMDIADGAVLVMNMTNDRGYRTTVIALANDFDNVCELLAKNIHFALRKPTTKPEIDQVLASACNLILIEKRVSFRHAVMINTEAWVLKNGIEEFLANGTCLDISQTGLRLKCTHAPTKGSTVFVNFPLPGSQRWIHTVGQVVWNDTHGQSGISFRYVPPQEFKLLREYLNARWPWPNLLSQTPHCLRNGVAQTDTHKTALI